MGISSTATLRVDGDSLKAFIVCVLIGVGIRTTGVLFPSVHQMLMAGNTEVRLDLFILRGNIATAFSYSVSRSVRMTNGYCAIMGYREKPHLRRSHVGRCGHR
jgi:hypothetical protein